jgi:hypothetical protein
MAAHGNVSRVQFGELAEKLNNPGEYGSGFSVKTSGPNTGETARDVYLVGGMTSAPEGVLNRPATGEDIRSYARTHAGELEGENRWLGGWGPQELKEQAILDVSTSFPPTDMGRLSAAMHGMFIGEDEVGAVDGKGNYDDARAMNVSTGMANPNVPGTPKTPANQKRQAERG